MIGCVCVVWVRFSRVHQINTQLAGHCSSVRVFLLTNYAPSILYHLSVLPSFFFLVCSSVGIRIPYDLLVMHKTIVCPSAPCC